MEAKPQHYRFKVLSLCVFVGSFLFPNQPITSASCCGGGTATFAILPKFKHRLIAFRMERERYLGIWDSGGKALRYPSSMSVQQNRMILSYSERLASHIQIALSFPLVWNQSTIDGHSKANLFPGDMGVRLLYEFFDVIQCVYKVRSIKDLTPTIYGGIDLTLPTGISPYESAKESFFFTGEGFYKGAVYLDIEKTVYPISAYLSMTYRYPFERVVNREYGTYVPPYIRKKGNQLILSTALSYVFFSLIENFDLTIKVGVAWLKEGKGTYNRQLDPTSGFEKLSIPITMTINPANRIWNAFVQWSYGLQGRNFPQTYTISIGGRYEFF